MDERKEHFDRLLVKLKVLESRIHKLETVTDEILNEVRSEYEDQIKVLHQKKEAIQQQLLKFKEISNSKLT